MDWNPERILPYRRSAPLMVKPWSEAARGRVRIGIWDLNASAGSLPRLLDLVEEKQTYFAFYSVKAPYQTGIALPGLHVAREWQAATRSRMSPAAAEVNVSADRIVRAATPVLEALPIEWLVVVVGSMISDTFAGWHNLFSTSRGNIVVVSTFGLPVYAAEGGRPFETALLGVALSACIAAMVPEVKYIEDVSTGSIFDFCKERSDIVKAIRNPHIDVANSARIPRDMREGAERILELFKSYRGQVTPERIKRQFKAMRRANLKERKSETKARPSEKARSAKATIPRISFSNNLKKLFLSLKKNPVASRNLTPKAAVKRAPARRKPMASKLLKPRGKPKMGARHK